MKAIAIIPYIGYKNAPKAIEWLCSAFGFQEHLVVPGDYGLIVHAELKLDNVMIMLGSSEHNTEIEFGKYLKHPADIGGETQKTFPIFAPSKGIDGLHFKS